MTTVILRFMALAFLITMTLGADNFQQRGIYYGEDDNVCRWSPYPDYLYLNINLDGQDLTQRKANAGTFCAVWTWGPYRNKITPRTSWQYADLYLPVVITFKEETHYTRHLTVATKIVQETTVQEC